jgi:hypothetical protein
MRLGRSGMAAKLSNAYLCFFDFLLTTPSYVTGQTTYQGSRRAMWTEHLSRVEKQCPRLSMSQHAVCFYRYMRTS